MSKKGIFLRVSPEIEQKLDELIEHYSNEVTAPGKTEVVEKSIEEMHRNATGSRKKATFEMDTALHRRLKLYAADKEVNMVEVVEEALKQYLAVQVY